MTDGESMHWRLSHHAHPSACKLADRHYSRKTIGAPQMMPPGRKLVFVADGAVWGVSWPYAEFVAHAWPGAWINTIFRNESAHRSSDLIRQAVAATRWFWPEVPERGLITFVDERKVKPSTNPGYCYRMAGFTRLSQRTKGGHIVLQLLVADMPCAVPPLGTTRSLFGEMAS